MFNYFIFAVLILIALKSAAQDEIEFQPGSLFSELKKFSDAENPKLSEIGYKSEFPASTDLQGKYFSLRYDKGKSPIKFIYVGRINSCRVGGCSSSKDAMQSREHEYFDYFILTDSVPTVVQVKVYNYMATHGQEVTAKGWLKQFVGYDGGRDLQVGKDVDGISGATISVYGITLDIQQKIYDFRQILYKPQNLSEKVTQ